MTRRGVTRAAAVGVAAAVLLLSGGRSLTRAATPAEGAPLSAGAGAVSSVPSLPSFGDDLAAATSVTLPGSSDVLSAAPGSVAANATDGAAVIPLPPSAYPGMVGLATAALSVWRYRRRRR